MCNILELSGLFFYVRELVKFFSAGLWFARGINSQADIMISKYTNVTSQTWAIQSTANNVLNKNI